MRGKTYLVILLLHCTVAAKVGVLIVHVVVAIHSIGLSTGASLIKTLIVTVLIDRGGFWIGRAYSLRCRCADAGSVTIIFGTAAASS